MGRSGSLIVALFVLCGSLFAQQEYTFRQIDSVTYNAFVAENWDEVINTGKEAIENDIDYFYLRLRLGIAYYNKNNFRAAAGQLEAAEHLNAGNTIARDYLYYSYLFAGQKAKAAYTASVMNAHMRGATGIEKPGIITLMNLETGPEFSNNYENNGLENLPPNQSMQYQDLYGNSWYTNLGIGLQLGPRLTIFTSFSNLIIDKNTQVQYAWNSPDSVVEYGWGFRKFFPDQQKVERLKYDYRLRQNNIYGLAYIYMGKGWSIKPALNYIHVSTKTVRLLNNSTLVQDTVYYNHTTDSVAYFQYEKINYTLEADELKLNNMVISLGIQKEISVFDIGLFGSWSNFYDRNQFQYGLSLAYYPLGNLWLYGNTTVKGLTDDNESWVILSQMIGGKVFDFLWAEVFGTIGNMKGTNESDAYLVYNILDDIDLKAGLNLIFVVSPSVQLSARYQYLQKTGTRYVYGQGENLNGREQELEYSNQSIIGGLKWIF